MAHAQLPLIQRRFGETARRDAWWVQPAVVFLVLSAFIVYATWAAFQGGNYTYGPYLSPFYSPELFGDSPHAWFGPKPGWWPAWLPFSPALLILWAPGGFRVTCYYYRGAYYKAFWADPPSCAVGEPRKSYRGERSLAAHPAERPPLLPVPRARLPRACSRTTSGRRSGSPTRRPARRPSASASARWCWPLNVVLLARLHASAATRCGTSSAAASTSCRERPCAQQRLRLRRAASTARHMVWAWCSLFSVAFADLYVRLCSMGVWTDWRIF